MSTTPYEQQLSGTSPFPGIDINGEIENAGIEWLHTNGAGAYSMSTVGLMHTRRYHGLLIAAMSPPLNRYLVVSHMDTTIDIGPRQYRLATHQFPGIAPTPGYRLLQRFDQDPLPRWTYALGKGRLERTLALVRGANAVVVCYRWFGPSGAVLRMKPLLPMRPISNLAKEHGAMMQRVSLRTGEVTIQPVQDLPHVSFRHPGIFVGSPDWWRQFEYSEDRRRNVAHLEDLWTPGTFECVLESEKGHYFMMALGDLPEGEPSELMEQSRQYFLAQDPGVQHSMPVRVLSIAASQFRATSAERPGIIAGYPWLGLCTRDSLIALRGICLSTGQYDATRATLKLILERRIDGFLEEEAPEVKEGASRSSPDASLWLAWSALGIYEKFGADDDILREHIYAGMLATVARCDEPRHDLMWSTEVDLIENLSQSMPLTWMDSRVRGQKVTARFGYAVEHQALWALHLRLISTLAKAYGDEETAERFRARYERCIESFKQRFWCDETNYPYDRVSAGSENWVDPSLRPNACLALAICPELFEGWQRSAILEKVRSEFLTPRGLRTLSPNETWYVGYYEGSMDNRRAAYHQGVAWVFLLGFWAEAELNERPDDFELEMEIRETFLAAMNNTAIVGQVAQVASGDAPHQVGGSPAQAWSVGELLRILKDRLKL